MGSEMRQYVGFLYIGQNNENNNVTEPDETNTTEQTAAKLKAETIAYMLKIIQHCAARI